MLFALDPVGQDLAQHAHAAGARRGLRHGVHDVYVLAQYFPAQFYERVCAHAADTDDAGCRGGSVPIRSSNDRPVIALNWRRFSTSGNVLPRVQSEIVGCDTPSCLASAD